MYEYFILSVHLIHLYMIDEISLLSYKQIMG